MDPSLANPDTITNLGLMCGEAGGQTFFAPETLITRVAVWRHHAQTPYGGSLKLWITAVDSAGIPKIRTVIFNGPVISVPFGDGIHPIEMDWNLDPPIVLPQRGTYYFAVQDYCGGHWGLLISSRNPYGQGCAWRSSETCFDGCAFNLRPGPFVDYDLAFAIDFCQDSMTPTRSTTWGELHMLYR